MMKKNHSLWDVCLKVTKVAIHQPNFLPWLGYFYKIHLCDVFVILDDVQYTKNSHINRTQILSNSGKQWLTVPIKKPHLKDLIKDVDIFKNEHINNLHKTVKGFYNKSAHYKDIPEMLFILENIRNYTKLIDVNCDFLKLLISKWFPQKRIEFSSTYNLTTSGEERIIDLVKSVGGNEYLSGNGARNYQNEGFFSDKRISLSYINYPTFNYQSISTNTICKPSILDYLACHGYKNPFM